MARKETTTFNCPVQMWRGTWVQPVGPMRAVAIFALRFTCTRARLAAARISGELARLGIATLRLDLTGSGTSETGSASERLSNDVETLIAVAEQLAATLGPPRLLVGHGLQAPPS